MMKRPKPGESEEDLLRMEREFLSQRAKNPNFQLSSNFVKVDKPVRNSLFAKKRAAEAAMAAAIKLTSSSEENMLLNDVENVVGAQGEANFNDLILGDIIERKFDDPINDAATTSTGNVFLKSQFRKPNLATSSKSPSIFGRSWLASIKAAVPQQQVEKAENNNGTEKMDYDTTTTSTTTITTAQLLKQYGDKSAIVTDAMLAAEVHARNISRLSQMREEKILAERQKLLDSVDSSIIDFLIKRKPAQSVDIAAMQSNPATLEPPAPRLTPVKPVKPDFLNGLPESNPAHGLLQRRDAENWLNFDEVETIKLEWMSDIPYVKEDLKRGIEFEARFDWKGVLLPYKLLYPAKRTKSVKDDRELYLHGSDPQRPGYTLQELFRLARSNVLQQRIAAFGAISGILNFYNQGLYDEILELPIAKIFFLLRYGLDDNTLAQLEVVSKAMAFLFYNEVDEITLDTIYENPDCCWQPGLPGRSDASDVDDPTSIENLEKNMHQLKVISAKLYASVKEKEEDSKTSMTDFQLAETDLVDCLLRSNILQRIYFILHSVRPDNSTVTSCLKLLIRLARTSQNISEKIAKNEHLHECLMKNFLPTMAFVDVTVKQPNFYGYPQHLYLKLWRVLISQHRKIALAHKDTLLFARLQGYIFNRENIRSKLIRVQIESLRVLRCLLLQGAIDIKRFKELLPALRQMLDWHYNHCVYEVGGPPLIRQHAAALLAAIVASDGSGVPDFHIEAQNLLSESLYDCCGNWLHKATAGEGVKEISQATLLATCFNVLHWLARHQSTKTARLYVILHKHVADFVLSQGFAACVNNLTNASILLRTCSDRRHVHTPLPNVGAVLTTPLGPQLVLTQTYEVHMLSALWRLCDQQLDTDGVEDTIFQALIKSKSFVPAVKYQQLMRTRLNSFLATNFFARTELKFIYRLLQGGLEVYMSKQEMFQLAYNCICYLPATEAHKIAYLYERYIFSPVYNVTVASQTLEKWHKTYLPLIYKDMVATRTDMGLTLPYVQQPILPLDWPYFQLNIMLKNYVDNVQQKPAAIFCEREVLQTTFNFANHVEDCGVNIVTPTEELMYLMIAFMGPDSQFLALDMQQLLLKNLLRFYTKHATHTFDFEAIRQGKYKFDNLYALFVDHFQAASYGDEMFSSLVLIPLAQKYDNIWRRRLWSDYGIALRFLNCDEGLLLGGLKAYLEPIEQDESLVQAYASAINTNLVRKGTLPYKIAKHHMDNYRPPQKVKLLPLASMYPLR